MSRPRAGFAPIERKRSSAMAPQISLPCVSAITSAVGPGLPLSRTWTNSVPEPERL
jgi:hypothetical protein